MSQRWIRFLGVALAFGASLVTACALPEYTTYKTTGGGGEGGVASAGGQGGSVMVTATAVGAGGDGAGGDGAGGGGGAAPITCAMLNAPDGPPTACSFQDVTDPADVDFINNCSEESLNVYWVDPDCVEEFVFSVTPKMTAGANATQFGDVWRVREAVSNRLLLDTGRIKKGHSEYTLPPP